MVRNNWTQRVQGQAATQELREVRDAAMDLAQQGQHAPGKARLVFQTVADVALIGTAVIGGALAAVHLWKALAGRRSEQHQGGTPEPAGAGRHPPRNRGRHAVAHAADEGDRHRNAATASRGP